MAIFSNEELQEFTELQKRYGKPAATLLPVLWRIQEKRGWIDSDAMEEAAAICQVPKSHVEGVVQFYTMFFDKPMGRFHVQVCTNVSCMLRGGEELYNHVRQQLGIENHGRTENGIFSLEEVECMGACGGAPMMALNDTFYECVTTEEASKVLAETQRAGVNPKPKFVAQLPELSEAANR
ncbi:MAG: NADH-quinone oxidoreductase subunit NuoE [Bacteroidota bacterium]|nr:NADH-quinone oxidoreductase subunit NuoE [Bacteroidota bacterium]MDP4234376.1 NADH-quinone oxidoreductase subunit NuoE [Bacteroidota bacterium]MDP4243309.1 NADH-quinone oxidoreductase subunit NuoE [Bacteroidota bacterium]MDP4287994.1 NADH-quinone oxidoreductase subunit NuoE [Bacteroidota bacterium]